MGSFESKNSKKETLNVKYIDVETQKIENLQKFNELSSIMITEV